MAYPGSSLRLTDRRISICSSLSAGMINDLNPDPWASDGDLLVPLTLAASGACHRTVYPDCATSVKLCTAFEPTVLLPVKLRL